jgi:hypothetical protein
MRHALFALPLLALGCATAGHHSQRVGPPRADRCAAQSPASNRQACETARDTAVREVRKLAVDDQVCIDTVRELSDTSRACTVRAYVEGVAPNAVQLEIRDAPPGSRYAIDSEWWFEETALAEVELQALGYALPGDAAR